MAIDRTCSDKVAMTSSVNSLGSKGTSPDATVALFALSPFSSSFLDFFFPLLFFFPVVGRGAVGAVELE
jgi:hypothetical protein